MELRIKELIKERGLTAKQVSAATGVTESGLCNLMATGKTTVETLERIARMLDVPVWELVVPCGVSGVMPGTSSSVVMECPECGAKLRLNINIEKI